MPKMTSGPARRWHPGMTRVSKEDIKHMKPRQRNIYRREGFTWADIKKIDQAIGRGEREITLELSIGGGVTITLPPKSH